jgi:hypothetical protein
MEACMNPLANNYPLVEVVWRDAEEYGDVGWNDFEDALKFAEEPCTIVRSIGYLLTASESHISLLRSMHSGGVSSVEKIPRGFIEEIYYLQRGVGNSV